MMNGKWLLTCLWVMWIVCKLSANDLVMLSESHTLDEWALSEIDLREVDRTEADVTHTIEGKVDDESGEPMIGVNVQVEGTTTGTDTDFDGISMLEGIDEADVV